jgi:hypothetical protein
MRRASAFRYGVREPVHRIAKRDGIETTTGCRCEKRATSESRSHDIRRRSQHDRHHNPEVMKGTSSSKEQK